VERRGEKDNQTTDPTLSLLKAIMVRAVDDFVVDSFRSVTRSFLFLFFCYINDLELLLNDLENRLYMAKDEAEEWLFNSERWGDRSSMRYFESCPAHSKAPSIFLQNFITTFSSSNYRKLSEERKISPVQISAEKQFTSLQNSTTFCFIFSPSARKKVLKVSCIAFFFKVFLTSTE
jgi:hypothetical protein